MLERSERNIGQREKDALFIENLCKKNGADYFRSCNNARLFTNTGKSVLFVDEGNPRKIHKLMRQDKFTENPDVAIKRLAQEIHMIKRFSHVPGMLDSCDPIIIEGLLSGYSMEFFDGDDLLQGTENMGFYEILAVFIKFLDTLEHLHAENIVHRDLKPENMLTKDGEVCLLDFGMCKDVSADLGLTYPGLILGTPLFIAPEQVLGLNIDQRTDIYSLGVILYLLMTRRCPFNNGHPGRLIEMHLMHTPPIQSLNSVDPEIAAVILKAMSKKPDERQQNVAQMKAEIEEAIGNSVVDYRGSFAEAIRATSQP